MSQASRRAYVTMLVNGDVYAPGVEALGWSLRHSGTEVPLIVMVTGDVSQECRRRLLDQGLLLRDIEPIENPTDRSRHLYPRFAQVFSKLRAWELVQYDKVVFLDADTIVLRNIDELFDRPAIAAAPDPFMPDQFNSGAMVLAPSQDILSDMLAALARTDSYDGGDQGFLNQFFRDWYAMPVEHRLPIGYNMHHFMYQFLHSRAPLRDHFTDEVRIIHYTLQKPWQKGLILSGGNELWWQMYYGAHPEADRPLKRRLHALSDHLFERIVSLMGG